MMDTRLSVGRWHEVQKLSSIEFSKIAAVTLSSKISKKNPQGFFLYDCKPRNKPIPASKNVPCPTGLSITFNW
jgi:hypothetical protein